MHAKRKIGFVAVVTTWALISVPGVVGQSKTGQVVVVNSSSQPVPTAAQGTTNITGTVTLGSGSTVSVGNTPSVNVANTPSINVANTPTVSLAGGASVGVTNPLDGKGNPTPLAILEASQPYEDICFFSFAGSSDGQCKFQAVPAGKRLVIQEFDALGFVDPGLRPVEITENTTIAHYFTATLMGNQSPFDVFATHQETRLYVGSTQTPICAVSLTAVSSIASYQCQLSGFLVDVP